MPANKVTTAPATLNVYDAAGRVIQVQRFASVTLTSMAATPSDYTGPAGQLKMVATPPTGSALTTTLTYYDPVGNVQYSVDGRGAVTQYHYDPANRRTNVLIYPSAPPFVPNGTNAPNPAAPALATS